MSEKRGRPRLAFTPEMDTFLRHHRGRLTPFALADQLGVSAHGMYRRIRELGMPVRHQKPRTKPNRQRKVGDAVPPGDA